MTGPFHRPDGDVQPRFVAYARSLGADPHDVPKGAAGNAAFMAWISARWREWDAETGHNPRRPHLDADHAAFDAWLDGAS